MWISKFRRPEIEIGETPIQKDPGLPQVVYVITYVNQSGMPCTAEISKPHKIHHTWYSSKRNIYGVYEKHEVTVIQAFLRKLKGCSKIEMRVK